MNAGISIIKQIIAPITKPRNSLGKYNLTKSVKEIGYSTINEIAKNNEIGTIQ